WVDALIAEHGTSLTHEQAVSLLHDEVGRKFKDVLIDAGVFKRTDHGQRSFAAFLLSLGLTAR
ncbi:galactose-1-phosphate uridylyltransferase, partial [Paenibacillus sepulcri]|nr:galactose-1-phosphate uridylyltransferase [Paenibacillus sepulcri]